MLETDAEDLPKRLSAALEDAGVSWLVREVSAAVQEGRAQETVKVTFLAGGGHCIRHKMKSQNGGTRENIQGVSRTRLRNN